MIQKRREYAKIKWSYNSFDQIPSEEHGVYAFWCRDNGRCIYVGQAKDQPIKKRLHDHWRKPHNRRLGLWIQAFGEHLDVCFVCYEKKAIDRLERRLIKLWKPEANKTHNPNFEYWKQMRSITRIVDAGSE